MDGGTNIGITSHPFSVRDYHQMAEAGVFGPDPSDARVELIRGTIVDMPAIGTPHLRTVNRLNMLLAPLVIGRAVVSVQNSVRLDNHSEPEPDLVLLRAGPGVDESVHPGPQDVLLVIEVSESTLNFDRAIKGPLYAEAGLAEYWIVNLVEGVIEVHRDPGPSGYRQIATRSSGRLALLTMPDIEIAFEDVLPR